MAFEIQKIRRRLFVSAASRRPVVVWRCLCSSVTGALLLVIVAFLSAALSSAYSTTVATQKDISDGQCVVCTLPLSAQNAEGAVASDWAACNTRLCDRGAGNQEMLSRCEGIATASYYYDLCELLLPGWHVPRRAQLRVV